MTVICQACQAHNRDKAMFCRGCAAKLPAFAATGPSALEMLAPARPRGAAAAVAPSRHGPGLMALSGARGWFPAVVLMGTVLIALVVWITLARTGPGAVVPTMAEAKTAPNSPLVASAVATTTASPTASPTPPVAASSTPAPLPTPAPSSAVVPFESALSPGEMAVDKAPAAETPSPARPAHTARVVGGSGRPSATAGRADPRVGCEQLFFAFAARCEANHCAEAAYARHPRCDAVREQRRRDEARRNLTSGY
ncbi:hypothetical protein [Variovorax sp. LT1R16]|uniref:hypothetical protein n=1 Tax=Variovorax sp. LT1R16 TaxID=3443728 RepID=UPI003F47A621